jgi:L-ascorbate metabolism protein UlaG (beta-lactamase superfamily)
MKIRMLGWAGVEVEHAGERVLIDAIGDPGKVVGGAQVPLPEIAPPARPKAAGAALLTHLHRDHADAQTLQDGLADGAPVLRPAPGPGDDEDNLWVARAETELATSGLPTETVAPWETRQSGPFAVTALPSVDAIGDPQIAWLLEAANQRVLHLGDTMFHGYWWRMKRRFGAPDVVLVAINAPELDLPHCQPPSSEPGSMTPEQAALATHLLEARTVVPMHYGAFDLEPYYIPTAQAEERFSNAAASYQYDVKLLRAGEDLDLSAAASPGPSNPRQTSAA